MKIGFMPNENPLVIGNIGFFNVKRPRRFQKAWPAGRDQHSFIYTRKGIMQYNFNNSKEILASAGEMIFIPKGTIHTTTYMDAESEVEIAQFDIMEGSLPAILTDASIIKIDNADDIFTSFYTELQSGAAEIPVFFIYKMYELIWNVSKQMPNIPYKFCKLQPALKEIKTHFSDNRKISYYANIAGMSESGFRRLFNDFTGVSPIEYRNRIRLENAKMLLKSGEYRIEEAAFAVGFTNLSFFYRSYKQLFGHSPGKEN